MAEESKSDIKLESRTLNDGTKGFDVYDEHGKFIRFITERQLKWSMYAHGLVTSTIKGLAVVGFLYAVHSVLTRES